MRYVFLFLPFILIYSEGIQSQTKDSIFPSKNISIQEIVVKGKKPPVQFQLDRKTFKASEFTNAANGNGVDLVKNLPGISLNGQNELLMRGSQSFIVLINGKPTQGDPSFILSQLPASQIESIEVISTPGASFDADGKSGVLNIITKSAPEKGLLLQSNLMGGLGAIEDFGNQRYKNPQRHSADIAAAWQRGKFDISTGVNYLRNDAAGMRDGDVYTILNSIKTSFPSIGERSFRRHNYGGRLSIGYEINSKTKLDLGTYIGKKYQSRVADIDYKNTRTNLITGSSSSFHYFNKNTADKEGLFSLASLGLNHQINSNTDLAVSVQYEGANLDSRTYNENLTSYNGQTLQVTDNPGNNKMHAYRIKADVTKKIRKATFQYGYQYRYDTQKGSFIYYYKNAGDASFKIDPNFSSDVATTNAIHAGYLQYAGISHKLSYQFGLRAEQTNRDLKIKSLYRSNKLSLLNLFPSYQFRYGLNSKTSIKTSLSRRIKRTNNYELNPIPEREHSETLEQGDPALLPELTTSWELGLERRLNTGNVYATIYHMRIKNPIQRVNSVYNDTILNRVFTNAGLAYQTGIEANLSVRLAKFWDVVIGGNIYKYDIKGSILSGTVNVRNNSWVYQINATNTFSLGNNWSTQVSVNYLSLRATAQGEDGAFITPSLTLKKLSKDKRWSFTGQWLFMDAGLGISNRQRITTRGRNFYTTTNYIYEPDQIQLSVGFQIQRKNRKVNLPQSEITEKEF